MAMPNNLLVTISKYVLGQISVHNYIFYRQIGLFWILVSLLFLFWIVRRKDEFTGRVAVFHFIYVIFSSFVLFQEQYFRYYGFYLLCSLILFYSIWVLDEQYTYNRRYLYTLLLVSPFLCFFLTWQMFWYILLKEFLVAPKKIKTVFIIFLTVAAVPILVFWKPLMAVFLKHTIANYDATSLTLRGFSFGLFLKPIYAIFQFIFGYDAEPTENFLVIGLFILALTGFIYRLYILKSENLSLLKVLILAGFIPFLSMYWLLEPFTLPGATQFESKHAMFFLPFLIASFVPARSRNGTDFLPYFFITTVLVAIGLGTFASFSEQRIDWSKVVNLAKEVQGKNGIIIVDGRSEKDFFFYSGGQVEKNRVISVYDVVDNPKRMEDASSILIVTSDWKSYQLLSLEQNWNTGSDTRDRYNAVSYAFAVVRRTGKVCTQAYAVYPLFAFRYELMLGQETVFQAKPQFFGLPYKDVRLPTSKDGVVIYGWEEINACKDFTLGNTNSGQLLMYYFIRCKSSVPEGTVIGSVQSQKGSSEMVLGSRGRDTYSDLYCRPLKGAEIWYQWHKRPAVTQSLRYPGSLWPSEGRIYCSQFSLGSNARIIITHDDIRLYVCYVKLVKG